jgi:hypothetical protein
MKYPYMLLLVLLFSYKNNYGKLYPKYYFRLQAGAYSFKKPVMSFFSVEFNKDIPLSKRSSLNYGVSMEWYRQHSSYDLDTNFQFIGQQSGNPGSRIYYYKYNANSLSFNFGYKYWIVNRKKSKIYI